MAAANNNNNYNNNNVDLTNNMNVDAVFGILEADQNRVRDTITAFQERITELEQALANSHNQVVQLQTATTSTVGLRREVIELREQCQQATEERDGVRTLLRASVTRTNNLLKKVEKLDARATTAEDKVKSLESQLADAAPAPPVVVHQTTQSEYDEEHDEYDDYFEGGDYYRDALYYRTQMRKWRSRAMELAHEYEQLEEDFERCTGDHYSGDNEFNDFDYDSADDYEDYSDDDSSDDEVVEVPTSGEGTGEATGGQYVLAKHNDDTTTDCSDDSDSDDSFIVTDSEQENSDSDYTTDDNSSDDDDEGYSTDDASDIDDDEYESDNYNGGHLM